ncbi:zinc finger BED domain-containing protein DAYSLEEPER-like isoform X2 [Solanum dulcamara]|nr:zinc finger BED domain-containing protein DAYSLEEPER-like isoform X2 [Solanum dulcamara]XP_055823883.1 zinc finger BED domain-containing protein DAYSLEEPER-like isoform X2 [Solanum dulcamara]XP_055823884.1 zinc finger BED domain-containing protein DAYSLEEPER-like isoform X2 [Solanum dulcamara]
MSMEMETKFQNYWQEDYSSIASMAVVLDPRYKLKLMILASPNLIHSLAMKSRGRGEVEMVAEMVDDMEEYDIFESQSELDLEKTQLDSYLQEPVLVRKGNEDLDVLKFWRDNRIKYSELSLMAHDLLSISITTIASESAFSIGGRVIGKYRSSILPENAEAKLCSRDWLYGHQASTDSEEEDDIAIDVDKIVTEIFN